MDAPIPNVPPDARQMTINTAGLWLLFGWACYVLLAWLVQRYVPTMGPRGAAIVGALYLMGVGGLLTHLAVQGLKFGRHLTYRSAIARHSAPVRYWLLTVVMGAAGTTLLIAGAFALIQSIAT